MSDTNTSNVKQTIIGDGVEVGRDLKIGDITQNFSQYVTKPEFRPLQLEQFRQQIPEVFLDVVPDLAERICKTKLLVLFSASIVSETTKLARYLALYLSDEAMDSNNHKLVAKEWWRDSNSQYIEAELLEKGEAKILLLTRIEPSRIAGYDLSEFQELASSNNHYVIITTDKPVIDWGITENAEFWVKLLDKGSSDPSNYESEFKNEKDIYNWYKKLTPREQLIAIGLSFFDGLFEDQFFAALEEVVESAWKKRDASLRALDYCDLDVPSLRKFFNFIETTDQRRFIEVRWEHLSLALSRNTQKDISLFPSIDTQESKDSH